MAVLRPDLMMKCVIPVVMAGIIGVRPFYPTCLCDMSDERSAFVFVFILDLRPGRRSDDCKQPYVSPSTDERDEY